MRIAVEWRCKGACTYFYSVEEGGCPKSDHVRLRGFGNDKGEGVKHPVNLADVICTWPFPTLPRPPPHSPSAFPLHLPALLVASGGPIFFIFTLLSAVPSVTIAHSELHPVHLLPEKQSLVPTLRTQCESRTRQHNGEGRRKRERARGLRRLIRGARGTR